MKKGHKSLLLSLSRITSVGTHSVPFLNNWNGKKICNNHKMKFHKWEPDVRCQILERLILLFFDFFQYLRFGREWRKWAGVAIIVSSTCTYIRLLKLVCSPQFFLKRRARSRGESVIEKTLLFFLSPCYFFRWLPLNWGCNDVNFLFLLH